MNSIEQIKAYSPCCEQEMRDKDVMLTFLTDNDDGFLRSNLTAHMTASAWVLSPDRTRVVMVYHNIYNSWSWVGGHADGDTDLAAVAMREVQEETGIREMELLEAGIFSLENLAVEGHMKNGAYVPSHVHMNITYLLRAKDDVLRCKRDENSGVKWMTPEEALMSSTEPWMVEHVYRKLIEKAKAYMA